MATASPRERIEAALDELENLSPEYECIGDRIRAALAEMEARHEIDNRVTGIYLGPWNEKCAELDAANARLAALLTTIEELRAQVMRGEDPEGL